MTEFVANRFSGSQVGEEVAQSEPFLRNGIEFIRVSSAHQVGVNNISEYYFAEHAGRIFEIFIPIWPLNECTSYSERDASTAEQMVDTLTFIN